MDFLFVWVNNDILPELSLRKDTNNLSLFHVLAKMMLFEFHSRLVEEKKVVLTEAELHHHYSSLNIKLNALAINPSEKNSVQPNITFADDQQQVQNCTI